jgi:hypothetical protein
VVGLHEFKLGAWSMAFPGGKGFRWRQPSKMRRMSQAIAIVAAVTAVVWESVPATAEPSVRARAVPIRKHSYKDVRQGLFALSKIDAAAIVMLGDSLTEGGP